MFFRNISAETITTDIGDSRLVIPSGKICEIEKRLRYIVKARRLPLEEVPVTEVAESKESVVEAKPLPPQRPRAIRGVASGDTVSETDDKDDLEFKRGSVEQLRTADLPASDDSLGDVSQVPSLNLPSQTERALANRNRKSAS